MHAQHVDPAPQPLAELRGKAMGSSLHIAVSADPNLASVLLKWAAQRVEQLEQCWSRFRPTSEVSQLNANPGTAVVVSADTVQLVQRAVEARRLSAGRFDPTLLQAMHANGYDRTFVSIRTPAGLPALELGDIGLGEVGLGEIEINAAASTVRLGPTTGFDPGGIGKGFAADLVARQLVERGAAGALVNIGGDVRCIGSGPDDGAWSIAIGDQVAGVANRTIAISEGGVASSTHARRRWMRQTTAGAQEMHHLLDPRTGKPAEHAANFVTVIASNCADAEWIATTVAAQGALPTDRQMIGSATVLLTDQRGQFSSAGTPEAFLRAAR